LLAGRGEAHKLTPVGTVEHDTAGNEVAFRYLDHLGTMVVWESPFYLGDVFFEILSKHGREEFVEGVQIPLLSASVTRLMRALFSSSTDMLRSS
jgi:hypothetical protein